MTASTSGIGRSWPSCARRAESNGLATVVVTFDRHPASVVRPESAPQLLCDLDQKLELLASAGVDRTVVVRFDEERANETAEEFVAGELVEGLDARLVVVGEDFHFGHGRKGNVALLNELGSAAGFAVEGVALASEGRDGPEPSEPISSTRIRTLVAAGRVEEAAVLLGRPHQVRGPVVTGDRRGGAELGFPTANLAIPAAICLPAAGSMPGGTSGLTGAGGRRRSRSAADRRSTGPRASSWSRPTCSISPGISTASRPASRSSAVCVTSSRSIGGGAGRPDGPRRRGHPDPAGRSRLTGHAANARGIPNPQETHGRRDRADADAR